MTVTVIGYDGGPLREAARAALAEATLVVGGARHLEAVARDGAADLLVLGNLSDALDVMAEHLAGETGAVTAAAVPVAVAERPGLVASADAVSSADAARVATVASSAAGASTTAVADAMDPLCAANRATRRICVVASGDPGFFGIVRVLRERGFAVRALPVASSVASAFAAVGLAWDDAVVVSAHGRDLRSAVNVCRAFPKVAVLTGPGAGAAELAAAVPERTFVVAQRLGEADQRVEVMSSPAAAGAAFLDPHVVLSLDEQRLGSERGWLAGWTGVVGGWALPESVFEHRDSMITKAEVRALALARLGPRPGMEVWDLGAGSGSVGIECARFGAAVVAVERDPESCARIRANAAAHGVSLTVLQGDAPAALADRPDPDAIFVGGGGLDVIAAGAASSARTVVVALAAIERAAETIRVLTEAGRAVDGVLLQSSRLAVLPGKNHRFAAANPVFLLWGERP